MDAFLAKIDASDQRFSKTPMASDSVVSRANRESKASSAVWHAIEKEQWGMVEDTIKATNYTLEPNATFTNTPNTKEQA